MPSSPKELSPQAQTVPSERSARSKKAPAAIWTTPVSPVTWTGTSLLAVLPLPSSPSWFSPHAHTLPAEARARLDPQPVATWVITGRPVTCTGNGAGDPGTLHVVVIEDLH